MTDNYSMIVYDAGRDLDLARTYQKSGIFTGSNAEQNLVKIHAGRALGIDPVTSLSNIHLVQGKITLGATVVGALIKRSGRYNYRVVTHTNEVCTLMFFEYFDGKWIEVGPSTFNMEDAKQAGVLNKDVWKKFPRNMLYARALTNGARWYCPDVFGGPIYTIEELEDENKPETNPNKNLSWKKFALKANTELGLDEEKVKEILKSNYDEYDRNRSEEMFEFLRSGVTVEGEVMEE